MAESAYATEMEGRGGLAFVSHAGFIPRLVAYVLDSALLLIPVVAAFQPTDVVAFALELLLPILSEDPAVWTIWGAYATLAFAYFVSTEAYAGRTLGKRVAGIEVTDLQMERAGPVAVLLRNVYRMLYHLPVAGLAMLVLDGLLVVRTGRRLGDLAGETLVVKVPDEW